ncbi:hypothetical protein GJ744_002504 [Endocarpon pusillum]|uniref:Methyltransferase domain-containing protein n=1 Tax=Endocarpon pusillum TaxID=364733 RepID=A0A8H7A7X7_9EURO|nr:hypothetical protein GJ744_002504 [Endocarpon pusillum]
MAFLNRALALVLAAVTCCKGILVSVLQLLGLPSTAILKAASEHLVPYWSFFYASFLKPHTIVSIDGQRGALESFYSTQADSYDVTRARLLKGREDMLSLAAAQLKFREGVEEMPKGRIWVDIGGGTGYNVEAMSQFIDVPNYFSRIYLVDFSPSLCKIARRRFSRLGWKNVRIICQDARLFRLENHETAISDPVEPSPNTNIKRSNGVKASLVTMSYALSMIPDFHSVIDSIPALLAPSGILSVVDFYVQNAVDVSWRNYGGGSFDRHVNWLGRAFWRSWFEFDRVALEPARRDYLEYRFGTILNYNRRHYYLGGIPYYTWIGCQKVPETAEGKVESPDVHVAEWLDATTKQSTRAAAGLLNLSLSLPLPSAFYQNHSCRLHYDEHHQQHTQFQNEYIYAFTWEDATVDKKLLKITSDDTILAITSAGDNILSYALCKPRRIHAVDLNPTQNHLLELKIAAFASLGYEDTWQLFGLGRHPDFRRLLLERMSPHLSSQAFQFWIANASTFTSPLGYGLYETGASRHAVRLAKYLFMLAGLRTEVQRLCSCGTIKEQRAIWHRSLRRILLSRILHRVVIRHSAFLWNALGVPPAQRDMIVDDYLRKVGSTNATPSACGQAVWDYMMDTLDPVVEHSLLNSENYFYSLCLRGQYTEICHPEYLSEEAHASYRDHSLYDILRIHTSPIISVLSSMRASSLTIAVIMDSMDWFSPSDQPTAATQIRALNRALVPGGRVLLRSAALKPWYLKLFEDLGFQATIATERRPGTYTDMVNMYASCWLCVKGANLPPPTPESLPESRDGDTGIWALEN